MYINEDEYENNLNGKWVILFYIFLIIYIILILYSTINYFKYCDDLP